MSARKRINSTPSFKIRLPASTSNLGPGFDCFGLALKLYLTIEARVAANAREECTVRTTGGKENQALPHNATNLIYRAMKHAAQLEKIELPPVELKVHNEIPLASGLGSSAAAIVGGIKLCGLLGGQELSNQTIQNLATKFEGHPDNVAASLHGGFVASCVKESGEVESARFEWPENIRVVVVSPHTQLPTHVARAALPKSVTRVDAVYNLQRASLFIGAVVQGKSERLWDAMHDRLHQPKRESLVPGLSEVLALPRQDGLLGLALSGAGPSVLALVDGNDAAIGRQIAKCFSRHKIRSRVRILQVDPEGCQVIG